MQRIDGLYLLVLGMSMPRIVNPEMLLGQLRGACPGIELQLLRADRVAGPEHLVFAAGNAVKAFRQKYRRSRSLAMEVLIYASCQRQIAKAIEILGLTPEVKGIALVAIAKKSASLADLPKSVQKMVGGELDDSVLEIQTQRKLSELKRTFGIRDRELEASRLEGENEGEVVTRLVVERSALLALKG